jgi:hypothetical protein
LKLLKLGLLEAVEAGLKLLKLGLFEAVEAGAA